MMYTSSSEAQSTIHLNVMELLVYAEIEYQLQSYPSRVKKYINRVEVATFALNRLPALYASSMEGKVQQQRHGAQTYKREIATAVRRGIAAVEQDPLRTRTPLLDRNQKDQEMAENALKQLEAYLDEQGLLKTKSLSWTNLTITVYQALNQVAEKLQHYRSQKKENKERQKAKI